MFKSRMALNQPL